jgi:hypothetical protein
MLLKEYYTRDHQFTLHRVSCTGEHSIHLIALIECYEKHEITASIGSLWSLPYTLRVWFYRYPLGFT